ncbi:hypothetical protein [Paracoccus marinaquae]|uniref:Lipoprotein n=1 Tax=Paracoccus marinaquae TaxID=2841926 RepID=A0ABS6AJM3_9RHOB|nr:hypothetical protein [Paracoccus marinaquae]MBU3029571.1 hypothetical protein [Paracoccus marinaquae]
MSIRSTAPVIAGVALLALTACADNSDKIAASYVSPALYQGMSCQQLSVEAQSVANRAAQASVAQDKQAQNDAVAVGVATVLFWPALFLIKGDGAQAAEVARLKGEMQAIETANRLNNCGITFGS